MGARREMPTVASILRSLGIGIAVGSLVCFVLLLIAAAVMTTGVVPDSATTAIAMAIASVSAFVGGWVTAKLTRERGLMYGAIQGALLCLLVVLVGIVVLREVRGTLLLVKMALMIASGALGGVLGVNAKKH